MKRFAQNIVDDHSKANDALKAAATSAGIKAPDKMNDKHQKDLDKFMELKAEEFDRAYIKHMVKVHEVDVDEFTIASNQEKNASRRGDRLREARSRSPQAGLFAHVEQLEGFASPVGHWEKHPLPSWMDAYDEVWLDNFTFFGQVAWGRLNRSTPVGDTPTGR